MKRIIPLVLVLIFPYVPIVLIGNNVNMGITFFATLGAFILAMITSIVSFALALWNKWDSKPLALAAMLIKLLQIPAYLMVFMMGLAGMLFVRFIAVTVITFLFDCVLIFMSGLVSLSAVIGARREGRIGTGAAVGIGITSFVFCIDVIMSVVLYVKIRIAAKKEACNKIAPDCIETEKNNEV